MARVDIYNLERWHQLAGQAGYHGSRLAKLLEISPRQLRRYAWRVFGRSTQEWLDELRLRAASDLLREHRSVKWVAYKLGFKQVSHFSREFKRHYGLSPTGYLAWTDQQKRLSAGCPPQITNVRAR